MIPIVKSKYVTNLTSFATKGDAGDAGDADVAPASDLAAWR